MTHILLLIEITEGREGFRNDYATCYCNVGAYYKCDYDRDGGVKLTKNCKYVIFECSIAPLFNTFQIILDVSLPLMVLNAICLRVTLICLNVQGVGKFSKNNKNGADDKRRGIGKM